MSSFYDVLKRFLEANPNSFRLSDCQIDAFRDHSSFLDNIPKDRKLEVVIKIARILHEFNFRCDLKHYSYDENSEPIKKMFTERKKESDKKGRIYKSDLKKAKDFRSTLHSFDELWKGAEQKNIDSLIEDGADKEPYFLMGNLVDDYIKDLESKTFEMTSKFKYITLPEKPSKNPLEKYLQEIVKTYNLKGGRNIQTLIRQLNETAQY